MTGAGGLSLTPPASYVNNVNAGTAMASYTYAGDDNHAASSDSKTFSIDKAPSTTVVTIAGGPFTYTGAARTPATVAVTGAGGLSLTPQASYVNNVNAGTAMASYTYAGDDNHTGSGDSETFTIDKAAATINVAGYSGVYDAAPHGAHLVSATGVGTTDLSASVALGGETFANVPGGTATWSFSNPNYVAQTGTATIEITPASGDDQRGRLLRCV